jgi:hypothetical protein
MKKNLADTVLVAGLTLATLGMALVAFGVAVPALFFPGVYLLAIGLLGSAAGAVARLFVSEPK